ncbi:hypothetical protein CYCD_24400 [Tenuifilaceae bacterium CYCD]|nr:hypothetical protein CYCD_24400 [Tenuifilaceae bacterium CYCD]
MLLQGKSVTVFFECFTITYISENSFTQNIIFLKKDADATYGATISQKNRLFSRIIFYLKSLFKFIILRMSKLLRLKFIQIQII